MSDNVIEAWQSVLVKSELSLPSSLDWQPFIIANIYKATNELSQKAHFIPLEREAYYFHSGNFSKWSSLLNFFSKIVLSLYSFIISVESQRCGLFKVWSMNRKMGCVVHKGLDLSLLYNGHRKKANTSHTINCMLSKWDWKAYSKYFLIYAQNISERSTPPFIELFRSFSIFYTD